jgi:hypothetical protein
MCSDADWNYYLKWNEAILSVVYPEIDDAVPVYLDLDDDNLDEIAKLVGHKGDPKDGLCEAVSRVVVSGSSFTLQKIVHKHIKWMREIRNAKSAREAALQAQPISKPPSIGFLALATLAALDMGRDNSISIAYYPRVADLTKLSKDEKSIQSQFHDYSERLWRELNIWIESQEGRVGLPTAYSLSKRYVGIPQSQALVRKADRQKLPGFFSQFGLDPGSNVSTETMVVFLNAWINSDLTSAGEALKRSWSNTATHERIAEIVSLELLGWDGTLPRGMRTEGASLSQVKLMASMNQNFLGKTFNLSLTYRHAGEPLLNGNLELETSSGQWVEISFQPLAGNLWRTSNSHGLDVGSVLEGSVNIRIPQNIEHVSRRFPRTVVPLVLDEIHGGYMEQTAVQLNTDCILLVRSSKDSIDQVRRILSQYARPGYEELQFTELPQEWTAFVGVQLFGVPEKTRFKELQPISRNQLTIAGGVRIPSSVRKWTALAAPEIRVAIADADFFEVSITDSFSGDELHRESSTDGALVVEMSKLQFGPGDYRVSVYVASSKEPSHQSSVRLRSSNEVDSRWHLVDALAYKIDDDAAALGAISAVDEEAEDGRVTIDGAVTHGSFNFELAEISEYSAAWTTYQEPSQESAINLVQIAPVSPDSCVYTGAHRMQIETIDLAKPWRALRGEFQRGECTHCHLVKQYPIWPKPLRPRAYGTVSAISETSSSFDSLTSVSGATNRLWDAALDSLMHLGGGTGQALNSLATQIDNDSIFAFNFANTLEQLGHLELKREADGTVTSWEVSPTCLAETSTGEWLLVGYWPPHLLEQIEDLVSRTGGHITLKESAAQPTIVKVTGLTEEQLTQAQVGEVVKSAGMNMLKGLPRLSSVGAALPRKEMPGFNKAEFFDVKTASWQETREVSRPGSFRLKRDFRSEYIFRSGNDVDQGTAATGTPYLVKYLGAQVLKTSLVSYNSESKELLVPFGVELPGLYGRALVLMSGYAPESGKFKSKNGSRNCRKYNEVEESAAKLLQTLLLS